MVAISGVITQLH